MLELTSVCTLTPQQIVVEGFEANDGSYEAEAAGGVMAGLLELEMGTIAGVGLRTGSSRWADAEALNPLPILVHRQGKVQTASFSH